MGTCCEAGAAQPWGVGVQCPPHFWDQRGTVGSGEYRGAVQWKWSLLLQQTVFIQYCTSDWISTPLTLVDTCQVNDIRKDAWVVFPLSTLTRLLHYSNLHAKHDRALYKVWHILRPVLSLTMINNTIGLGLPLFINATTTSLQTANFNKFNRLLLIFACLYPHIWKSRGYKKIFFARSARESYFVPPIKIRGAAPGYN